MFNSVPSRLVLASAFVILTAVVPASAQSGVAIRIYDAAATDATTMAAAIRTAAAIVAEAGLPARWFDCTGDAEGRHCDHLREGRSLVVRLRPTLSPGTRLTAGSVETRTGFDAAGLVLGFAVVDSASGAGALATIFMDRVREVARRASVAAATLLGRAIAHEVGHLLLATNEHSRSGLMREVWKDAELQRDRSGDWLFAASDRERLREHASARLNPDRPHGESTPRTESVRLEPDAASLSRLPLEPES